MTVRAAHLVDAVLPWEPASQWVLTVPYRLRYQMAWNPRAELRGAARVHARAAQRAGRACGGSATRATRRP
jgi:hypothetical protein